MANNVYGDKKGRYEIKPITIETVDQAVFDYFDKKLSISVDTQRGRQKVPVIFASGERWKLIRKNNFRDENGTLILPIISIRRNDIDRTRGQLTLAQEQKTITISKIVHGKTPNIQNLVDSRKRRGHSEPEQAPVYETITIPYPDSVQVFYQITLWTQFQTQMNEILERIFHNYDHLDSFVIPVDYNGKDPLPNSYFFVGRREGNITKDSNDDYFTSQERMLKYVYDIKVPAYLILDPTDEALAHGKNEDGTKFVYKKQSRNQIQLKEQIISLEEFEKLFGKNSFS